jgi:uncharacterized protein DUF5916
MVARSALFILLNVASVAAQEASAPGTPPPRRTYGLQRAVAPIQVDGSLADEGWKDATVIALPYEYFPGDNIPAPVRTEFLVTFGEEHLYLAFRAFDPEPGGIRAHLADRDAITTFQQDDHVGFILDPFNDERRGFQFRVNPLGVQADAVFSELEGIEDFSWDAIWESAGRITAEGYEVEVAIPFNQLRFPRTEAAQTWGFDAFRSWPRSVRHRIAAKYTDRNRACILCQADKLTGLAGMTPGRNLEFDPTLTGHRTDRRDTFPGGPLDNGDAKADLGLTARWGITPNLILNATVNPDFSQVEADVAQLDVNTRFALFFPEKRPFFLEGIDFFATPLNTVFTRTIVDPAGGLKLTGKSGANAYGVFIARDEVNNILLPSNQGSDFASLDAKVTSAVARYRRDVGGTHTLGAMYAGRESSGYHNRVFGLDAFLRPGAADTVRVQALRAQTANPAGVVDLAGHGREAFAGNALYADYNHISRHWFWFAGYQDLGRDFRADSGFVPRVDIRQLDANLGRIFDGRPGGWFAQMQLGAQGQRIENHDGLLTDQDLYAFLNYQGPLQSVAQLQLHRTKERFAGRLFEYTRVNGLFELRPSGDLRLNLDTRVGGSVDYANARQGDVVSLNPRVEYRLGRSLEVHLGHTLERLSVAGGRLFTANLTQGRLVYHLGTRAFARAILQYTDVDRVAARFLDVVEPRSKRLFSQLLFSYKVNPQTVLLVGYSDNYSGRRDVSLTQADRTFFLKLGYAWVL